MKNKFIKGLATVGLAVVSLSLCACDKPDGNQGNGGDEGDKGITYETFSKSTVQFTDNGTGSGYNRDLYYRNDLTLDMGDPMLVYDDGTFYAYGTRGGTNIEVFTSTDLSTWSEAKVAFAPELDSWAHYNYWAPDVQKIGDKWYMYYTAQYVDEVGTDMRNCQMGVAVADSPEGPFIQYTGKDADGNDMPVNKPAFHWARHTILDTHVFQDDDGGLYMYFSYDTQYATDEDKFDAKYDNGTAEIWGVKMKDPVTWDFSTLTPLISAGYKTYQDKIDEIDAGKSNGRNRTIAWETWSPSFDDPMECVEGPYMIKKNGKYFLTYCANSFVDNEYAVGYAVSDDPLGAYVKPNDTYLENMILGVPAEPGHYTNNRYKGFTTGTGHASICKIGEEYMFAYHAHYNRTDWGALKEEYGERSEWRALGVDYLYFDKDGKPYANGPTYSLQNLPSAVTGYKNLALGASIRAEGTDKQYLNDNFTNRAIKTDEVCRESQFKAGTRSIEITFDAPVYVRAVNVYNSYDYEKSVKNIKQIDFGGGNGVANAKFNTNYIVADSEFAFPHSAFNVELNKEIKTDKIVITIQSDKDFALGEIEVMGRKA